MNGNPLAHLSDDELVAQHSQQGANSHFLSEMLRRHKQESVALGNKMWWLNWLLLVFTIVICALTIVLVLVEVGMIRRPHEQSAGGGWVLWGYILPNPTGISGHAAIGAYDTRVLCEEARRKPSQLGNLPVTLICLPDTVDPRGPKGQ